MVLQKVCQQREGYREAKNRKEEGKKIRQEMSADREATLSSTYRHWPWMRKKLDFPNKSNKPNACDAYSIVITWLVAVLYSLYQINLISMGVPNNIRSLWPWGFQPNSKHSWSVYPRKSWKSFLKCCVDKNGTDRWTDGHMEKSKNIMPLAFTSAEKKVFIIVQILGKKIFSNW